MRLPVAVLALSVAALLAVPTGASGVSASLSDATGDAPRPLRLRLGDEPLGPEPMHAPIPAAATGIGPGSHLLISMQGGLYGCTANFVWSDATLGKLYLGAAGHCFLPEDRKATHGPGADWDASGVTVRVCVSACDFGGQLGFFRSGSLVTLGPVAYARQTQSNVDVGNDFGLVEIPTAYLAYVRPHMPVFHGPTATDDVAPGKLLCHYGAGMGVGEVFATQARMGVGTDIAPQRGSWYAALAAAPGDSGSALQTCAQDADGVHGVAAAGILTHIIGAGIAGTTMSKAIAMAKQAGLTIAPVYETA